MLENRQQLCRVWLALSEGVSARNRALLVLRFGGFEELFDAFPIDCQDLLSPKTIEELGRLKAAGLDKIALRLETLGIRVAFLGDETDYPALLCSIPDPPDLLFYRGSLKSGDERAIAIVGSRRETRYGRAQAHAIARDLARQGITVVSGLAWGIDTAAHKGALDAGGRTIAVLGSGVSNIYPEENRALADQIIASGGAVISELPPAAEPLAFHFPIRNRIVSGLAQGLLLVEAKEKSGTLITLSHALEQGREVFALPGEVDAPGSIIPHRMIREGARLCTCAADILEDMGWIETRSPKGEQQAMDLSQLPLAQQNILRALADEAQGFEEMMAITGLDAAELGTQVTLLEMDGLLQVLPGKSFRRK
ncbi:MAG: DNA-processing protein DprA [Christensenellales bacterium]